jgi:predicted RNA-binding Zn-ribbon protein involved in translation (DUF1610 family)
MAPKAPAFLCPNCGATYKVLLAEASTYKVVRMEGESVKKVTCKSCGGPLPAREGKFLMK